MASSAVVQTSGSLQRPNQKSHIWVMAAINSLRSVGFTKKSEWIEPGVIDQEFPGLTPRKKSLARPAKVWDQSNFGKKHRGRGPGHLFSSR
jgi:hypothetical protein